VRLLHPLAASVARTAAQHAWDVLVVAGDEDVAAPFVEGLPANAPFETVRSPLTLGRHQSATEIADLLADAVTAARERAAYAVAERARDSALSGGSGAVGLADVLGALAEGRVHQLVVDPARAHEGVAAPDGRLFQAGVVPAGIDPGTLRPEPLLLDRMVVQALETDAAVVPVTGDAAALLGDLEGVAATLRW
jgi:hypothetical protein